MILYERKRGPMKEFKLHLENDLLGKIQEAAERAGFSTNQMIVNVLEENFQGQVSFDYAAALAELVREAQSRPVGERFVLADLDAFSRLSVSTAEKGCVQPSTVRARLGRTFNRAVSQGQVPGIARDTMVRDGKTVLRFLSGTAVYVREEKQKGENEMKTLKVLEWNIHQQGGHGGGKIPEWVASEIKDADVDIAILTEVCTAGPGRDKFIQSLKDYRCYTSENVGGNDVLIAVKECYVISDAAPVWVPCYGDDMIPENLQVDINVDGTTVSVFGVRIKTTDDFGMRRSQFAGWLLPQLSKIKNPVIIAGDFNNNRRGAEERFNKDRIPETQRWSIVQIDRLLETQFPDVIRKTPEGSSIYEVEPERGQEDEFAEDHFLVKGLRCQKLFDYDRTFTTRDKIAYFMGKDFAEPWRPGMQEKDRLKVKPPYPDHAILMGEFVLE